MSEDDLLFALDHPDVYPKVNEVVTQMTNLYYDYFKKYEDQHERDAKAANKTYERQSPPPAMAHILSQMRQESILRR